MILTTYRFVSTILVLFSMLIFAASLLKVKLNWKSKKIFGLIVSYAIVYSIICNFLPQELMSFISIFYFSILLKVILRVNIEKIIFYVLVVWLIGVLCDIGLMIITNFILKEVDILNISFIRLHASILLAISYLICSKSKFVLNKVNNLYKKITKINYPILKIVLLLCLFFLFDMICLNYMSEKEIPIIILFSLILLTIVLVNIIYQNYQIIMLKETNNLLSKNIDFYIKRINEYRILKHNLKSKLNGLKTVSNKKSVPYINALIEEYNDRMVIPKDIMEVPNGLNGIIYEKVYEFNDKNLQIAVENKIRKEILKILTPKNYNLLCEALGITLDNALEAASKSKDKIVYLKFNESKENIIIKIMNTFSGSIDLDKLGTINYTSKKLGHGLGLFSLLSKDNLKINACIKNKFFINTILIPKK